MAVKVLSNHGFRGDDYHLKVIGTNSAKSTAYANRTDYNRTYI